MERSSSSDRLEELLAQRAWVRRVARALVLDDSRADDLEQEAWVGALRGVKPGSPRAWLGTVLRRAASNMRRAEGRRTAHEAAAPPPAPLPTPEEMVERAEVVERVWRAVRGLEEPYRATVLLRFFEDIPPAVIGERLGVPVETVRTRLRRALAILRQRLDDEEGGDRRRWAVLLLPFARSSVPGAPRAAAGGSAPAVAVEVLFMTLKAKASIAAAVVLLLGGWLFLGRQGDATVRTGPPAVPSRGDGPPAPSVVQGHPGTAEPARSSASPPAATTGTAGPPLPPGRMETRDLHVFCGLEGATITARYKVCGGDPDPAPVAGVTDSTGAVRLAVPPHPDLMDGFEVEGRATGYATTVVRLEEFPRTKSVTLQMQRGQPVTGRVVDEQGLPVVGARVEGGLDPVESGADGTFEVSGYGSAVWLRVRHGDFLTWSAPNEGIPVPSAGLEILLSRGLAVSGRVTFEDGSPAAGATVVVDSGPSPIDMARVAKAGADGTYALSGLLPGGVKVRCISGGQPGTMCQDESRTVEAGAGGVDFTLKSSLVHVRVLDEEGRPFRNAGLIRWWLRDGVQMRMDHLLCEDGDSDIEIPPGIRLTVAVRFRGFATGMAELAAEGPAGRREVVIRMRRLGAPGRLEIVARDPTGRPVRRIRVTLRTIAGLPLMWFGGSRDFDLDANGTVVIDGVPAQHIEAEIGGPFDPASEADFLVPWRRSFSMKDGGTERLEAALRTGGRLRVRVAGPDGHPAKYDLLRLRDSDDRVLSPTFWSRSGDASWSPPREGDVALFGSPVPAGSYRIEALRFPFGEGGVVGAATVEVVEGKVVEAVVRTE